MERNDKYVGFYIKESLHNNLHEILELEGYSISSFMREALRNELRKRGFDFRKKTDLVGDKIKKK